MEGEYDDSFCTEISHITDEVNAVLLLTFESITDYNNDLKAVLMKNFILGVPRL